LSDHSLSAIRILTADRRSVQRKIGILRSQLAARGDRGVPTDAELRESIVRLGCEVVRLFSDERALIAAARTADERKPRRPREGPGRSRAPER
jgi:hypothetical protein